MTMQPRETPWRKSSRSSGTNGQCVEARLSGNIAQLSDSKLAEHRPILDLRSADYDGFIASVKAAVFT